MTTRSINIFLFLLFSAQGSVLVAGQSPASATENIAEKPVAGSSEKTPAGKSPDQPMGGRHQDHNPKHGGTFFMAMDNKHHLEGTLLPSGIFRVYLYDAYARPLSQNKVKQASGSVQLGDSPDAPKIPLTVSKDGRTLEVALGKDVKFPFTLTLLLHFPDTPPNAKPELFTFPFSHYINPSERSGGLRGTFRACSQMRELATPKEVMRTGTPRSFIGAGLNLCNQKASAEGLRHESGKR